MSRPLRHTIILVLAALGTVLAALGGWRYARASAPVNGPIVLISIDTLRSDHLPAYGYKKVRTPAIDELAADGIVFERAYSHSPQTLPAHVSMLSGRLPFETGVRDNVGFAVKPGERLLPQMLRERGYSTAAVVSAFVLRKETGINQGFDFFDGDMPPNSPELNIGQVQRDGAQSEAIAERWLDAQRSPRLFLFLHLYEPHKPYSPPPRFAEYAPYDGEIAYADDIVGSLLHFLRSHQLYDRSTIVLVSDHGEGLGDHGEQEHGLFLYDEAIHVPLIIKQAGNVGAGRRVTDPVQHLDLVPTILDLVKAPASGSLRGRSLTPLLDGSGKLSPQAIYSEALYARYHFGWSELTAMTDERYRYISAPREELYDLARDPHERENLVDDRTNAGDALRAALDHLIAGSTIQVPGGISPEDRERLAALGYVGGQSETQTGLGQARPDPKDKREILETYRAAVDLASERKWGDAIARLQQILAEDPGMTDVWAQLATFAVRADRFDQALAAYRRVIELTPTDANAYIGAGEVLLRLRRFEEAKQHGELAVSVATDHDSRVRTTAHQLLARIALARHDAPAARDEAELAQQSDPTVPMPAYVEARILYDQGRYADALPLFEQAITELQRTKGNPLPELHYYTADTLSHLERYPEAEAQLLEELKNFPQNTRARGSLAMLYQATGRSDDAGGVISEMVRISPTADTYALAARLWTMFGNTQQANAVRAEARRTLAGPARAGSRGPKH